MRPLRRAGGFTLTELLIVITIIAILSSLITAAAINALRKAKQTGIQLSMNQISQALETKKVDWGAYPPNVRHRNPTTGADRLDAKVDVEGDFVRMFKKAFPRSQEPPDLLKRIAGTFSNNGDVPDQLRGGLSGEESLYFWLGGFSSDPQFPISGPGGPAFDPSQGEVLENRNGQGVFDITLLQPRNADNQFHAQDNGGTGRYIVYQNAKNQQRRINFWTYVPKGLKQPLVYFDASRHRPSEYFQRAEGVSDDALNQQVYPFVKLRDGASPNSNNPNDVIFVNKGKFQILHAGLDDTWGDNTSNNALRYPDGPFVGETADNLASFANGKLSDESKE